MSKKTLLTYQEAKGFSELGESFPACKFSDILQTEEWEFGNCLGISLYNALLDSMADYSTVSQWVPGAYTAGAKVKNKGLFWVALQNTNTEPVTENQHWSLAPKFNEALPCGELYNELWCNYLGRYLSLKLAKISTPRTTVSMSGNGVTRFTGDGMQPATKNEIDFFVNGLETQIIQTYENMKRRIKEKIKTNAACFPGYNECGNLVSEPEECNTSCSTDGCQSIKKRYIGYSAT